MSFLKHDVCNRGPLLHRGVYTSGIVRTGMQEEDGTRNGIPQGSEETIKVETSCGGVIVRILDGGDVDVLEYRVMIGYAWQIRCMR